MPGARVEGLAEFRAALKALDVEAPRALRDIHKRLADQAAEWARKKAASGTRLQQKAAGAIKGSGTLTAAAVAVSPTGAFPFANAAFFGAKRHSGWYAAKQFEHSPPQFPKWVGNDWDTAVSGQGPYAINEALAEHIDDILDDYGDMVDDLTRHVFPDRRI